MKVKEKEIAKEAKKAERRAKKAARHAKQAEKNAKDYAHATEKLIKKVEAQLALQKEEMNELIKKKNEIVPPESVTKKEKALQEQINLVEKSLETEK